MTAAALTPDRMVDSRAIIDHAITEANELEQLAIALEHKAATYRQRATMLRALHAVTVRFEPAAPAAQEVAP